MSPNKTVEEIAAFLTDELTGGEVCPREFDLVHRLTRRLTGFGLLRVSDADGELIAFTPDKRVAKILPDTPPIIDVDTPPAAP